MTLANVGRREEAIAVYDDALARFRDDGGSHVTEVLAEVERARVESQERYTG